jgi:signal peptidase I
MKGHFGRRAARVLMLAAVAAGTFLTIGPSQLGGPANYVIVDGDSMEPTYHDGDLIIATKRQSVAVGDIITFTAPDTFGSGFRVIHRVVSLGPEGVVTKGDNRIEADPWALSDVDILGTSFVLVPQAGRLLTILRTNPLLMGAFAGATAFVLALPSRKKIAATHGHARVLDPTVNEAS